MKVLSTTLYCDNGTVLKFEGDPTEQGVKMLNCGEVKAIEQKYRMTEVKLAQFMHKFTGGQ